MKSKIRKNFWLQDIKKYEYAAGIIRTSFIFGMILFLFYESFLPAFFLFPVWIIYMKAWAEDKAMQKEQQFRSQFRDSIQAMAAALKAGYSVENAIRETKRDILPMYGKDTRIIKEYDRMVVRLNMNCTAAQVLEEFSERVRQEDVGDFVNVFAAAKISGGDSVAIIRNAVRTISEKIDTEKEINTILASKKLEFNIMCAVPFIIIFYMKITFSQFLEVLYGTAAGTVTMSICLAVYISAWRLGRKMIHIEV